jgi:hypothetical protein
VVSESEPTEEGQRMWIDYDDGHSGGYPHECDRDGMYEVTTNRRSWRVRAATPEDALVRIPGALTARFMFPARLAADGV